LREENIIKELQINHEIRDREVRLLDADGAQMGVVSGREAQQIADERQLDLVKISPTAQPPVCKLMDYGKYRFEQIKREKEVRKNQKIVEMKEMRLSMNIGEHDLNVKAKLVRRFLEEGNQVKVSIRMRGRQNAHANLGVVVMEKFAESLKDVSTVYRRASTEGRQIIMILAPQKA